MTCDRCSAELRIGDYPFCRGAAADHRRPTLHVQPDSVPGGFTVENAWREPRTFYSQSEYEKALAADGLELRPKWVPGSKTMTNWATMDPYTLENGRILAERQAQTKASDTPSVVCETARFTTRTVGTFTVRAEQ